MPRNSSVLHWPTFLLVKHWCGFLSSRPVLDVAVYFIVLYMTTNFNERNYHRVTQKRNILHSPNNHSPCCKLSWLNPCGFTKGIMCELPAHIKGKKENCAYYISSPVNVIINIFHSFWPGMCSALEYGEFLIRIMWWCDGDDDDDDDDDDHDDCKRGATSGLVQTSLVSTWLRLPVYLTVLYFTYLAVL